MATETPPPPKTNDAFPKEQLDAHRAMVLWLFVTTLIAVVALACVLALADPTLARESPHKWHSTLLLAALAGALGGFVSCLRRLYAFEDIFPRKQYVVLFKKLDLYLIAYSTIPPLVGIIAASAVYCVFAGGMLKGPMFPDFTCAPGGNDCKTLQDFLGYWRPCEATDYAKAIVWGFISGFSERFFVDILNQFGSKAASGHDAT